MRKRIIIVVTAGIAVVAALALRGAYLLQSASPIIEARNAGNRSMAWVSIPYPVVTPDNNKLLLPLTDSRFRDWSWQVTGDILSLQYPTELSTLPAVEQMQRSCPPGVDPEDIKAMKNFYVALLYPGSPAAIDLTLEPLGEFFTAELPGGGVAVLRLEPGATPASVQCTLGRHQQEMKRVTPREALLLQHEVPPAASVSDELLEASVIRCDVQSVNSVSEEDLQAVLQAGVSEIRLMLEAYTTRHGAYPDTLARLAATRVALGMLPTVKLATNNPLYCRSKPMVGA